MQTVNMHEAKSQLSALVKAALDGEEVVIAKAGNPLVRLVPYQKRKMPRRPGRLKGLIKISPDFDEIDDEIMDMFEQGR
jgi:prevent-host-death family protein